MLTSSCILNSGALRSYVDEDILRGMSVETRIIPLNHNESYWLLDDETAALYASQDPRVFSTYPNYAALRDRIARYAGVSTSEVLLTAGSDAAIRVLLELYRAEGKRILLPIPTFYGYERILAQLDVPYDTLCYREVDDVFVFPTEETIERITAGTHDVVFLCQPSNPLGCLISDVDVRAILDAAGETVTIVVDEAYFEFAGKSVRDRLSGRVVILRTLSKAFGLAGARIGYLLGDAALVACLEARMLPWTIAHSTVHAALCGLDRVSILGTRVRAVIDEREQFSAELREVGITVYPSCTNFLLTRLQSADAISDYLASRGILVARGSLMSAHRDARDLLEGTLRIATPSPDDRSTVVAELRAALDKLR